MSQRQTEFIIKPNAAHHRYSWVWPFAVLVVICVGIALRFAWLGYWMILPFAVLDMLAVALVLKLVLQKSNYVEKVSISERQLQIQHIQKNKDQSWEFPLHWTQLRLKTPHHRWYPHRLQLGCRGEWVEIGQCLTDEERRSLADAIRDEMSQLQAFRQENYA